MMSVVRDSAGRIAVACDYEIADSATRKSDPQGDTIIVWHLEVSSGSHRAVQALISTMLEKHPQAKWCRYFRRVKYPDSKVRKFSRDQAQRRTLWAVQDAKYKTCGMTQ